MLVHFTIKTFYGHSLRLTSPVLEISGVTLQFIRIGRQNSLKWMTGNEELNRILQELFEQIFAENRVFLPQETVKTKSVILIDIACE